MTTVASSLPRAGRRDLPERRTNHPYFKFLGALAAAGITSGEGPGTFGVDDPITRGETAVFLSAVLGLFWQY